MFGGLVPKFQARIQAKRAAQTRVVNMIISQEPEGLEVDRPLIAVRQEAATIETKHGMPSVNDA
jgi:hypothetical protein